MTTLDTSRDVRFGGTWSRPQRAKNAAIRTAVRIALGFIDVFPERLLLKLGAGLGRLVWLLWPSARRLAEQRIAVTLPSVSARSVARASFENAGRNLGLCLLLRRSSVRASTFVAMPQHSRETLEAALAEGSGALFVSAHIGPFELIPATVVEHGFPASIVVRESYDPALDAVVDAHRLARGVHVIHRGDPGAGLKIVRALRRGHPVGVLPDLGARVRSEPAPFLATNVDLPTGATDLARRLSCPIVVGTLVPSSRFEFSLEIRRLAPRPAQCLHRRLARTLGESVARAPEHWLWMGAKSLRIADPL